MNPRLVSSKKWTAFPPEYLDHIRQVVKEAYPDIPGHIVTEGRIYPQELLVRIGFLEDGRLKQANFEASVEYKPDQDNAMKMVEICIDALGAMIEAYFEAESSGEDVEFPQTWKEFEFLKQTVFLQFSTVNSALEAEADRILGIVPGTSLVFGEEEPPESDLH